MFNKLYVIVIVLACVLVTVVFDTFPRSERSELEKRRLASFPRFTFDRLWSGDFTKEVSLWFSDSEPFRDDIMAFSMNLKKLEGVKTGDDNISFIAAEKDAEQVPAEAKEGDNRNLEDYENRVTADSDAKIGRYGIVIVGKGKNVRALMGFKGSADNTKPYAEMVNKYQKTFGKGVQVYCMIAPTAIEYYCPDKAKNVATSQKEVIATCYKYLDPDVKAVDCYTTLGKHANEDIFLRTDHHWSPLGGFYAAEQFAKVAKVTFKPLSSYTQHVVHGYVGSMYGYSNDASIKDAPEDFIYWKPKGVEYSTTYINYKTKDFKVIGESGPVSGDFYVKFPDGSTGAYCTFMGSDAKITKIKTNNKNGRRLAILKDSYGNVLPGYLFYGFEEIHVIDHRYFLPNLTDYVKENKLTDFLVALNIFNACNPASAYNCTQLLTQDPAQRRAQAAREAESSKGKENAKPVQPADKPAKKSKANQETPVTKEPEQETVTAEG